MENGVTIYKPQSAVVTRREMAKIPAIIYSLEPVERSVFLASTDKTIAEYNNAEELANELAKALKFIAKDVGYRDTDEGERGYLVVRVCEILKRYYSALTLRDFRMAFEMSITGELDEYLPKGRDGQADRGHYQQFNAEYVCKILNAYKMRRSSILQKAYKMMPEPERKITPEKQRDINNRIKQECIDAFKYFRDNGMMPNITTLGEMLYYDILSKAGLAPEIVVTQDEQKTILARTINELVGKGRVIEMRRVQQAGMESPDIQHGAYIIARSNALKATFERMVADGINITDYIKFD